MLLFAAGVGTLLGTAYITWDWWDTLQKDLHSQTIKWSEMFGHIPAVLALLSMYICGLYTLAHA